MKGQNQKAKVQQGCTDKLRQRCHVAGKEIDMTRLPFQGSEWRVCNKGCQSLSRCSRLLDD